MTEVSHRQHVPASNHFTNKHIIIKPSLQQHVITTIWRWSPRRNVPSNTPTKTTFAVLKSEVPVEPFVSYIKKRWIKGFRRRELHKTKPTTGRVSFRLRLQLKQASPTPMSDIANMAVGRVIKVPMNYRYTKYQWYRRSSQAESYFMCNSLNRNKK